MRKLYPFLTLCLLLTLLAANGVAQVTFRVDMRYQSLAPGELVVVRGSAPSLGEWEGSELALSPGVDPVVYSGTVLVPELASGEVLYKYVIVRAGGEEVWEERGNRVLARRPMRSRVLLSSSPTWRSRG